MAFNCLMHQSIDHHHPPPPPTRTWGRVDSQAIEQFVYLGIVATVLGKFEVDLPRQSWLRGKLPLFNQLVVATVWGHGGGGHSSDVPGGGVEAVVMMLLLLLTSWPKYMTASADEKSNPLFRGGGGGGWRLWICCCCCYWPFGQSISRVVFSVIQLLVKSLWYRIKVAMGLKKCCRVVSSFTAVVCRLCCRVVISLKLSCSRSFEHEVQYDT